MLIRRDSFGIDVGIAFIDVRIRQCTDQAASGTSNNRAGNCAGGGGCEPSSSNTGSNAWDRHDAKSRQQPANAADGRTDAGTCASILSSSVRPNC